MKNILVTFFIIFFVSSIAYSASTPLKKSGSKFSDQRQGSDPTRNFSGDNSPQMKSPGTKYSDQNKQSDPTRNTGDNNVPLKDSGVKYSDTRAGISKSGELGFIELVPKENNPNNENIIKSETIKINILNYEDTKNPEYEYYDLQDNKIVISTKKGCGIKQGVDYDPNGPKNCEKIVNLKLGLKNEPREKLREVQMLLKLIKYDFINDYPYSSSKITKAQMNIRGLFDTITISQIYSYLININEPVGDLLKLQNKMKKKQRKNETIKIIDRILPILQEDIYTNGISDICFIDTNSNISEKVFKLHFQLCN